MLDRTIAPSFGKISNFSLIEPDQVILSNGIPLYTLRAGSQEVIKLEFILKSGSKDELKPGLNFFTAQMLMEGTSKRNSSNIASALDYLGIHVDATPGLDRVSISVYCLSSHIGEALSIFKEILTDSIFPKEELNTQKSIKRDSLTVNLEKNQFVASRKIRTCLFDDHPYGISVEIAHVDDISRDDLLENYRTAFFREPLIIASGFVRKETSDLIEEYLGGCVFSAYDSKEISYKSSLTNDLHIDKPDSLQSSIRMGRLIPSKEHPDHLPFLFCNEIFGGYFGSRLMKNIREDKGYTYGVSSQVMNLEDASMQIIGADVKKEFAQATIDEIHSEMKKLRQEPISKDELETVRNYMLGSFLSSISTPFSLADKFKSIHFHNLGYDFYRSYLNAINTITSEHILKSANSYFNPEKYSTVIVG